MVTTTFQQDGNNVVRTPIPHSRTGGRGRFGGRIVSLSSDNYAMP